MRKFKLPESRLTAAKGRPVTINGHEFNKDGEFFASDEDGAKLIPTLVRFYGCTTEHIPEEEVVEGAEDDASLTTANTQS